MNTNWIVTSMMFGLLGGIITFYLTGNWTLSIIASFVVIIIIQFFNRATRYMRAFYTVVVPLLCNIYFTFQSKTEYFDIEAGLRESDKNTIFFFGTIAVTCLVLDYLERNNKLNKFFEFNINSSKVDGSNNITNQIINKKD